jgi:Cell wall-active antibiotics response 4TMS YvqF
VNDQIAPSTGYTVRSAVPIGEMRVLGLLNTIRRFRPDRWTSRILVRAFFSDVTLDLREVELPPMCTIDVNAWFAQITIIVPPEVDVDFEIFTMIGEAKDGRKKRPSAPLPGAARVQIVGSAHMAEVALKVKALGQR